MKTNITNSANKLNSKAKYTEICKWFVHGNIFGISVLSRLNLQDNFEEKEKNFDVTSKE